MKTKLYTVTLLLFSSVMTFGQGAFVGTLEPYDRDKNTAVDPPGNTTASPNYPNTSNSSSSPNICSQFREAAKANRTAANQAKCQILKNYLLKYAQALEIAANNNQCLGSIFTLNGGYNPPACPDANASRSSTPNYYTGTDKSPVESMKDFSFLDSANPNSTGGTTAAQRSAMERQQKEQERRANFQNLNNTISDLSNGLNQGQKNAIANTQEKIRDTQNQMKDQYRQTDGTGLLNKARQNEVSTDDITLEDDIGEQAANYLVNDFGKDVSEAEQVARTLTGFEEEIGGVLGRVSDLHQGIKTVQEIRDGNVETIGETLDQTGLIDLSDQTRSAIEVLSDKESFEETALEKLEKKGKNALDNNYIFNAEDEEQDFVEINLKASDIAISRIPIVGDVVGGAVGVAQLGLLLGGQVVEAGKGIRDIANATGKLAGAVKRRVTYEAKKWFFN